MQTIKSMKTNKNTFTLILLAVIFGGGILIYSWNYLHGKNLNKAPEFDLALYEDPSWYTDKLSGAFHRLQGNQAQSATEPKEVEAQDLAPSEAVLENNLEEGYIYFKNSFRLATAKETNDLIASFLQDFSQLKNLPIENLEALDKIKIELPAMGREKIIEKIKISKLVQGVEADTPPQWIVSLAKPMFRGDAEAWLQAISPDILLITEFPSGLEYIARADYRGIDKIEDILYKLKNDYSDVALIR